MQRLENNKNTEVTRLRSEGFTEYSSAMFLSARLIDDDKKVAKKEVKLVAKIIIKIRVRLIYLFLLKNMRRFGADQIHYFARGIHVQNYFVGVYGFAV